MSKIVSFLIRTNFCAKIVLSPPGKCSSNARTIQLAIIVNRTAYSKGGHSIMNRVHRRTLVSSVKKKSEEGPGGCSPPGLAPCDFRDDPMSGKPKGRTLLQSPLPPKRLLFDRFSAAAASAAANLKSTIK